VGVDVVGVYEALWRYCGGVDEPSLAYLMGASRGLTRETITRFKLFSIQDYSATNDYLRENFGLGLLKEAGLVSDGGNLIFFQHRLIIPFIEEGRIVFLQARRIDDGHPRYMHLKRPVPLYNKDTLKGLNEGDRVYICEGVFDAMIMEQEGYRAVAILGVNSFKPEMVGLFRGLEVVLCLDNDESGRRGVETIARMFWEQGQIVRQKVLPEGVKDITEYFLRHRTIGEFKNPTKKEAGDETSSN
jgi:DNA primase